MDTLLNQYISSILPDNLAAEVKRSIDLLESFDVPDYDLNMLNIITFEDWSVANIHDLFVDEVNRMMNYVLSEHGIILHQNVSLRQKNELAEALFIIQDCERYDDIINLLDTELDPEEKFAEIVSLNSSLTVSDVFTMIESFDPILLDRLREVADIKHLSMESIDIQQIERISIITNHLRLFKKYIGDKDALGLTLISANVLLAMPLKMYLPFIADRFKTSDTLQLVLDIYSFIAITLEGHLDPLTCYRSNSHLLLDDINMITRVDIGIVKIVSDLKLLADTSAKTTDNNTLP